MVKPQHHGKHSVISGGKKTDFFISLYNEVDLKNIYLPLGFSLLAIHLLWFFTDLSIEILVGFSLISKNSLYMKKYKPCYYIYSKIFLPFATCFLGVFLLYFPMNLTKSFKIMNSVLQWAHADLHLSFSSILMNNIFSRYFQD